MAFNIGLSGLRAANADLSVTGNNIANVGSAGFKQSRAEFADLYAASVHGLGSSPRGSGVQQPHIAQLFYQGNINDTQNPLDLAINGNGFFITKDGGDISYTRAGYFKADKEGYIVNNFNQRLQGYKTDSEGRLQSGVLSDLQIAKGNHEPKATSRIEWNFNLDSTKTPPATWQAAYDDHLKANPNDTAGALTAANKTFDPADPASYNHSTSVELFDGQGNKHHLTQYFVKTGQGQWQMKTLIDGRSPTDPASTEPASVSLEFDPSGRLDTSKLAASGGISVGQGGLLKLEGWVPAQSDGGKPPKWTANGASAAPEISIDLQSSTQFASAFGVNSQSQNGYTTGQLSGVEIDERGMIFTRYTNGMAKLQGQVALADFANVQGLVPLGKTSWAQTLESGEAVIGAPSSGTLGKLQSHALEEANIELSEQLVNLIVAQRNYQANAKTIETESALTQTLINLR